MEIINHVPRFAEEITEKYGFKARAPDAGEVTVI